MHGTEHQQPPALPEDAFNPYVAPVASTFEFAAGPFVLGGRGERLLAVLLDSLLYGVCFLPLVAVMVVYGEQKDPPPAFYLAMLVGGAFWLALFVYNLLLLQREGQTIGKRLLKLRIVRADGSRADLGRIFGLRMLVPGLIGAVPCVGFLFSLADALAIFGEQQRCIHDIMADTIVVVA